MWERLHAHKSASLGLISNGAKRLHRKSKRSQGKIRQYSVSKNQNVFFVFYLVETLVGWGKRAVGGNTRKKEGKAGATFQQPNTSVTVCPDNGRYQQTRGKWKISKKTLWRENQVGNGALSIGGETH